MYLKISRIGFTDLASSFMKLLLLNLYITLRHLYKIYVNISNI